MAVTVPSSSIESSSEISKDVLAREEEAALSNRPVVICFTWTDAAGQSDLESGARRAPNFWNIGEARAEFPSTIETHVDGIHFARRVAAERSGLVSGDHFASISWESVDAREAFLVMIETYVDQYQPQHLILGSEADAIRAQFQPPVWSEWLSIRAVACALAKAIHPQTVVH